MGRSFEITARFVLKAKHIGYFVLAIVVAILAAPIVNLIWQAYTPMVHWIWMAVLPNWFPIFLTVVLTVFWVWWLSRFDENQIRLQHFSPLILILIVLCVGLSYGKARANYLMVQNVEYVQVMPDSEPLVRVPYEIADRLLTGGDSTYSIGEDLDPSFRDGRVVWTAPHTPNGVRIFGDMPGYSVLNGTTVNAISDVSFKFGEGQRFWANLDWRVLGERYFVDKHDDYYVEHEGQHYIVVPYSVYHYGVFASYLVPGGVFITSEDGNIQRLSIEEAQSDPRLANQPLIGFDYAERYAQALEFSGGWFNQMFAHRDQSVVPRIPTTNQMPYLIVQENSPTYLTMLTPFGSKSEFADKILIHNTRTNTVQVVRLEGSSVYGPLATRRQIRGELDGVFISDETSEIASGTVTDQILEVTPFTQNGKIYWTAIRSKSDSSSISGIVIFRSQDDTVIEVGTISEAESLLSKDLEVLFSGEDASEVSVPQITPTSDLSDLTNEQLHDLIDRANQELRRR